MMLSTKFAMGLLVLCWMSATAWCQTTQPTSSGGAPPANTSPDEMLRQLLGPVRNAPIQPEPDPRPKVDQASVRNVAPNGMPQNLIREGTYIIDKIGRLTRTADGMPEFTFETDGQVMKEPPMLILPNTKLMGMEDIVKRAGRSPKFRVTAMVTEYNSRNYMLIEKAVVPPETNGPILPVRSGRN